MPTLTQAQMQMYAASAGLNPPDLWAAIGMAESSGRTDVVNPIGCVGWLQINQPEHVKAHPNWTVAWLQDPMHNAQAAKVVYQSQGLGAWEAYTSGAYRQYYKGNGVTNAGFLGIPGIPNNPLNPFDWWNSLGKDFGGNPLDIIPGVSEISGVVSGLEKGFHWISTPYNWVRIGYVIIGGALLAVGVNLLVRSTILNSPTTKTVIGGVTGTTKTVAKGTKAVGRGAKSASQKLGKKKEEPEKETSDESEEGE